METVKRLTQGVAAMHENAHQGITLVNERSRPGRLYGPRVITSKNIGRDLLKSTRNSLYRPHQGAKEMARRRRQMELA
jgi:hypothetical protein